MTLSRQQVSWGLWPLWVAATAVGNAFGAAAFHGQERMPLRFVSVPVIWLIVVTLPAFLQWLILRHWLPRAGWWVLARSIGSFGAIHVFASMTRGADVHFFLGGLVSGALSGAIAGLALVLLLRHAKKNKPSVPITTETGANERNAYRDHSRGRRDDAPVCNGPSWPRDHSARAFGINRYAYCSHRSIWILRPLYHEASARSRSRGYHIDELGAASQSFPGEGPCFSFPLR